MQFFTFKFDKRLISTYWLFRQIGRSNNWQVLNIAS
jgi:hypothetical protein